MSKHSVGLIGLGLLGTAIAERMLSAGLSVVGYDLDPARREQLQSLGGEPQDSTRSVAASCRQIVLCLPDSQVVAAVVSELQDELRPGALLIDATTGDPAATVALAAKLADCGIGYVDATVAGSSEQLRRGEAVVMIGGTPADVARSEPILQTWGPRRFHVGPAGSGARLKLVVNLVLGLNRAVLAEGLGLASACGLDLTATLDVLKATPAYSRVMDTKGGKMLARDYAPQARLSQHLKDVRLIRDLACRQGAIAPLSAAHEALLQQAVESGLGNSDNSAIMEVFQGPGVRCQESGARSQTPES